jgi:hypothetical protein
MLNFNLNKIHCIILPLTILELNFNIPPIMWAKKISLILSGLAFSVLPAIAQPYRPYNTPTQNGFIQPKKENIKSDLANFMKKYKKHLNHRSRNRFIHHQIHFKPMIFTNNHPIFNNLNQHHLNKHHIPHSLLKLIQKRQNENYHLHFFNHSHLPRWLLKRIRENQYANTHQQPLLYNKYPFTKDHQPPFHNLPIPDKKDLPKDKFDPHQYFLEGNSHHSPIYLMHIHQHHQQHIPHNTSSVADDKNSCKYNKNCGFHPPESITQNNKQNAISHQTPYHSHPPTFIMSSHHSQLANTLAQTLHIPKDHIIELPSTSLNYLKNKINKHPENWKPQDWEIELVKKRIKHKGKYPYITPLGDGKYLIRYKFKKRGHGWGEFIVNETQLKQLFK